MMQNTTSFEPLNINPDRVCEGISKIGYSPSSAIMDIVDNSVSAGATSVRIEFLLKEDSRITNRNSIDKLRIIDNGSGMSESDIKTALDIGSYVNYSGKSLSKFGLGLKSAGFSLGERISVVSKQNKKLSKTYFVDRGVIRDKNSYGVCITDTNSTLSDLLNDFDCGTIIEIENPVEPQDSAAKIQKELREQLGIVYFHFLNGRDDYSQISISLKCRDKEETIEPLDIMFWEYALNEFDPDTYDGKLPCKVLNELIPHPEDEESDSIKVQVSIFPQDRMSGFAGFTDEEQKQISSFKIKRDNSGFFFFRNGRLIRWGDKIAGVNRNDIGFRAKVMLTTDHDDLFHVDVSKQNLMIPEEMLDLLRRKVRVQLSWSRELFSICKEILKKKGTEGSEFNKRTENFEEHDTDEDSSQSAPKPEKVKRRKRRVEKTKPEILEKPSPKENPDDTSSDEKTEPQNEEVRFQRVRYSDHMTGFDLWATGADIDYGTFVLINKRHSFYELVLSNLEAGDASRQALESLIFACAVAENKTIENLGAASDDVLEKVFERFQRILTTNLDSWSNENQDLFDS